MHSVKAKNLPSKTVSLPSHSRRTILSRSITEGGSFSLMVALGETYFPAFAIASGLGNIAAGLITTLPLLVGAFFQIQAPQFLPLFKSHRKWVLCFTTLQGITFLPIIYFATVGGITMAPLFFFTILYSIFGMLSGPVWNGWVSSLFPSRLHAIFIARRNRRMQFAHITGFLISGLALHYFEIQNKTIVFAGLFVIALFARCHSIYHLYRQPDLESGNEFSTTPGSPFIAWKHLRINKKLGHTFLYLLTFQFGVGIAGPYFTPFMLSHLHLNYVQYTCLVLACYLGKIMALPASAKRFRAYGATPIFRWNGLAISLIPLLFILSPNFTWLLFVQFFSGLVWAGFELVSIVYLMRLLPKRNRTVFLTYYHFGNALAVSLSSLIGGLLLKHGEGSAFFAVFILSTVLRFLALYFFLPSSSRKKFKLLLGDKANP